MKTPFTSTKYLALEFYYNCFRDLKDGKLYYGLQSTLVQHEKKKKEKGKKKQVQDGKVKRKKLLNVKKGITYN